MPRCEMEAAQWAERDGLLIEPRLAGMGLKHGVTTRRLGNMKDDARRREAAAILGLSQPLTLRQVHGVQIHRAGASSLGAAGDGWILDTAGVCVGVYAADCVPLYVWAEGGAAAGVFHAGWRGTAAGMPRAAVEAFLARGIPAASLSAALGPHIGACCYKVGREFERSFPPTSLVPRGGELYLDLDAEIRRQLTEAGLRPERIGAMAPCTASRPDDYFSFRRDKQDARMLALLSLDRWPS